MIEPNECEKAAMRDAGMQAGQYIESLGRTDMVSWTEAEWDAMIGVVCSAYVESLLRQQAAALAAMNRVQPPPF